MNQRILFEKYKIIEVYSIFVGNYYSSKETIIMTEKNLNDLLYNCTLRMIQNCSIEEIKDDDFYIHLNTLFGSFYSNMSLSTQWNNIRTNREIEKLHQFAIQKKLTRIMWKILIIILVLLTILFHNTNIYLILTHLRLMLLKTR